MILITCVDNNMGMLFNHRRQSQDRVLKERILKSASGKIIWMNHYSENQFKDFENYISKYDEVQEIISLSGEYDYQLKILANDIYSYNNFAVNVISNSPHIGQYHSSIVLAEVKKSTKFKLD